MSFESMYIGTTGMKAHSTWIQTIGNNLANVNTLGFKKSDVHFETLISETLTAGNPTSSGNLNSTGFAQSGKGVGLGAVLTDFRGGNIMSGSATTDLAISGDGFFRVVDQDTVRYTRAGNFRFDNEGFLVDPNGYHVQGKQITNGAVGGTGDIQLNLNDEGQVVMPGVATTAITMGLNVGDIQDNTADATDPFFSMFKNWDTSSNASVPLSEGSYGFSNPIRIYDADGNAHEVTLYMDKVSVSNAGGKSYYEYMITIPPGEDGRAGIAGTSGAGIAMIGTMVFASTGKLESQSAFSYDGDGDVRSLSNWAPAAFAADGGTLMNLTFTPTAGSSGASTTTSSTATTSTGDISINFGLAAAGWETPTVSNAAGVGHQKGLLPSMASPETQSWISTNYAGSSVPFYQSQDGSPVGYLQSINVDAYGFIVGNFSNGLQDELAQVTLYNFTNEYGLKREGSNHFSATTAAGEVVEGDPGTENFGHIQQTSLEASNVDMADQFAKMIVSERGFQANSKVISTTDEILKLLGQLKR